MAVKVTCARAPAARAFLCLARSAEHWHCLLLASPARSKGALTSLHQAHLHVPLSVVRMLLLGAHINEDCAHAYDGSSSVLTQRTRMPHHDGDGL